MAKRRKMSAKSRRSTKSTGRKRNKSMLKDITSFFSGKKRKKAAGKRSTRRVARRTARRTARRVARRK